VIAYVGILVFAVRRTGFSLRPRWDRGDPALSRFARLAVWGVLLHSGAGLLLGAAIVAGNGVAGGVVAYQVAFVFFLAPYAVLAQPLHTAILPELSRDAAAGDLDAFARSIRWALDRMAWLVIPVSAGLVAVALPLMRLVAFGSATKTGPALLAAGLASLALGLYPYGAFLLLARSYYALGDSRTPAVVAIGSAVVGVVTMIVGSLMTHGAARVAALGLGHSTAYLLGVIVLTIGCRRRTGRSIVPRQLPIAVVIAGAIATALWGAMRALDPSGRIATVACLALVGGVATGVYALAVRRWWRAPALTVGEA
jgi:putative peptidoglycan lipid II flippase